VLPNGTLEGSIVLIPIGSPPEDVTRKYQALGVAGVVMFGTSEVPGFLAYNQDNRDTSDITIPTSDMAPSGYRELVGILGPLAAQGMTVMASLDAADGNHWRDVFRSPGLYVAQIFIGLLCIANTILASINLANVIKYRDRRSKFSVPQVILGIQVLANLIRLAQIVDPNGMRAVYSFAANRVLATFTYPMIIASALLMTLFWYECLVKVSIDINPFLSKMKIPFFIISAVICLYEYVTTGLRARNIARIELLMSLQIFYSVIAGLLLIFYIVTSIRIMLRLRLRKLLVAKAKTMPTKTAVIFIWMGVGLGIWVGFLCAATTMVQTPEGYATNVFILHAIIHLVSLALIVIFTVNKAEIEASKKSGSSTYKGGSGSGPEAAELTPRGKV
jgi:hypothetical protein